MAYRDITQKRTDNRLARMIGDSVEALDAAPEITVETWSDTDGVITLDLFHFLRQRLEYLPRASRHLSHLQWRTGEKWERVALTYARSLHVMDDYGHDSAYWPLGDFLSNNDDNLLSEEIMGATFTHPSHGPCVILQVGCNWVPAAVFRVTSDEPHDLFDWNDFSVSCTAHHGQARDLTDTLPLDVTDGVYHPHHVWDRSHGDWVEWGGSFVGDPWDGSEFPAYGRDDDGQGFMRCPTCGARAEVYAPSTW